MIKLPTTRDTKDKAISTIGSHPKAMEKWMRVVGSAEGISFLLLLFVAMPLKYLGDNPILVRWLGPVHGGLFLLYLVSAVAVARIQNWRLGRLALAFVASVIPFGPFLFEAWSRRAARANV